MNAVEAVILSGTISVSDDCELTCRDFGYVECAELTDLATIWKAYAGDGKMVYEVWRHLRTCPHCAANREAVAKWREWRDIRIQETME